MPLQRILPSFSFFIIFSGTKKISLAFFYQSAPKVPRPTVKFFNSFLNFSNPPNFTLLLSATILPRMVLHYIEAHNYLPPEGFLSDLRAWSEQQRPKAAA